MFKLSPRLQLIYDHLIPGKPVWDFCCDHGYLGLNAYESGLFPEVHFVDQVRHIIEHLRERFAQDHHLEEHSAQSFFHPQAGEAVLTPVRGTAVIAGVGPSTVLKILEGLEERKLLQAERLILVPHGGEEMVRKRLAARSEFNYQLSNQDCKIEERGRIRKLLILDRK